MRKKKLFKYEKYNVVSCTHKVYSEYGNVGAEFDYITTSGFG